jgi:hypothetical protein
VATTPQFVAVPNVCMTKFTNSDGTSERTIFTPGSNGSRIMALVATSTDTASAQFNIHFVRDGVSYLLDTVAIPAATTVTPTTNWNFLDTDWFTWLDSNDPHIIIPTDVTITATPTAAVTSGKEVTFLVFGGNF